MFIFLYNIYNWYLVVKYTCMLLLPVLLFKYNNIDTSCMCKTLKSLSNRPIVNLKTLYCVRVCVFACVRITFCLLFAWSRFESLTKWFPLTRAKELSGDYSQAGFATTSVRRRIGVLAVLLRLFVDCLLYLEWAHSSKVSTVVVRWLKVFSRLPVVSLFQPNRVTSHFNEG